MAYRWYGGKFLMFLTGAPLFNPELDNTFWLFLATGIPNYIINHPFWATIIDISLVILAFLGYVRQDRVKITWLFLILFFIQSITLEAYGSSHSKTVICIFITLFPFCFRNDIWIRLWEFARYYVLYVMLHSTIAKIYYGGLFEPHEMTNILKHQHAELFALAPNGLHARWIQFWLNHPGFTDFLYFMIVLTQAIYTVGFFTKKFDKLLAVIMLIFSILTYVFMRIYNLDLWLLFFPLWFSSVYFNPINKTYSSSNNNDGTFKFIFRRITFSS